LEEGTFVGLWVLMVFFQGFAQTVHGVVNIVMTYIPVEK